jgi:hypothetical protein
MANLTQLLSQRSVTGMQVTAGAAEETLNLVVDGAAPAASIAVPAGSIFVLTDFSLCAATHVRGRLQQSDDNGVSWFDHFACILPGGLTRHFGFKNPIKIIGAANRLFRVRVQTPGGVQLVTGTLRVANEP